MIPSGGASVRVAILDDHVVFADALCMAVSAAADLECIGHTSSIADCIELALREAPDVFILDYQLGDGDGLQCARELYAAGATSRMLMLTANASPTLADHAAAAGITGGVLAKHTPLDEVLEVVRNLAAAPS